MGISGLRGVRTLVFGVGGGGDVVGAAAIASMLEAMGADVVIGSVVWERYVVDPVPGPPPLEALSNCLALSRRLALADGDEYYVRGGRKVFFQAAKAARMLNRKVALLDLASGACGVAEGLNTAVEMLGVEAAVAVDVGGDVLAKGFEEDLWSPLADSVSCSGLYTSRVPTKIICVFGLGVDGELSQEYLLERLAGMARRGALMDAKGLDGEGAAVLERLLRGGIETEASRLIYEAYKGGSGPVTIREGSRTVGLSPLSTIAWFLDPGKALEDLPLVKTVTGSRSIGEAREMMNSAGVATELDFEEELFTLLEKGASLTASTILEARRRALARTRCSADQ